MSPLIVPAETVRLRVSNTNTRASLAATYGSMQKEKPDIGTLQTPGGPQG